MSVIIPNTGALLPLATTNPLWGAMLMTSGKWDYGINIKSDEPIGAYSHTYGSASSGAGML